MESYVAFFELLLESLLVEFLCLLKSVEIFCDLLSRNSNSSIAAVNLIFAITFLMNLHHVELVAIACQIRLVHVDSVLVVTQMLGYLQTKSIKAVLVNLDPSLLLDVMQHALIALRLLVQLGHIGLCLRNYFS